MIQPLPLTELIIINLILAKYHIHKMNYCGGENPSFQTFKEHDLKLYFASSEFFYLTNQKLGKRNSTSKNVILFHNRTPLSF